MLFDIRFCKEADGRAIAAIDGAAQPFPWSLASIMDDLKNRPGEVFYLGAFNRSDMVGFTALEPRQRDLWMMQISVDPAWHGWGAGSQLMCGAFVMAEEMGFLRICLSVRASNRRAIGFYGSHGFIRHSSLPRYYGNGEDGIRMIKGL